MKGYSPKVNNIMYQKTHGLWNTPTYRSWKTMKQRCRLTTSTHYERYGGRGITYTEKWEKFEGFLADMGVRPDGMTLDRIDNNGNYEPSNCKWSSAKEQSLNRPSTKYIEYKGKTQCIRDWGREYNIPRSTLQRRITDYGWSLEKAIGVNK